MKKLLSVLLAVSIMATPLVSRVSVATWEYEEETLPQEAEKEQSWFQKVLNETKKAGTAGWLSKKEIANIASIGAELLYELMASDPQLIITTVEQVLTIFAAFYTRNKPKPHNRIYRNQKDKVQGLMAMMGKPSEEDSAASA